MSERLNYTKEMLFEALNIIIASVSVEIHENGFTSIEDLKDKTKFNMAICLKSFYLFYKLDKTYTKKEFAKKEYLSLYAKTFKMTSEDNIIDLLEYLDLHKYSDLNLNDEEKFILLCIFNLPSFYTSKNINKIKHLLNTYISKVRACLKNSNNFISNYNTASTNLSKISYLFKFLIENS